MNPVVMIIGGAGIITAHHLMKHGHPWLGAALDVAAVAFMVLLEEEKKGV